MSIRFWRKATEYVIIRNSSKPHSISVGITDKEKRAYPNDSIYIRTIQDNKIFNESQMTPDEALIIASGLIKLAYEEITKAKSD